MSTSGVFGRVLFELSFRGEESVSAVQNRVSAFARSRLDGVLAECLSGMVDNHNVLAFERVELDLGKISASQLEQELAAGITDGLREWLTRIVPIYQRPGFEHGCEEHSASTYDALRTQTQQSNLMPLLVANADMKGLVASALHSPSEWAHLMTALREKHTLRNRLVNEISPIVLNKLLQVMAAGHAGEVTGFIEALLSLHKQSPLVATSYHDFRRVLWECAFAELLRTRQADFNFQLFVDRVLQFVAARYSFSGPSLTEDIMARLNALRQVAPQSALLAQLLSGAQAQTQAASTSGRRTALPWISPHQPSFVSPATSPAMSHASRRLEHVAMFLEWGLLSWAASNGQDRSIESAMLGLIEESPDELGALIRHLGVMDSVQKRIAGQFSETLIHRLFYLLAPTDAPWVISYTRHLRHVHAHKPVLAQDARSFAKILWEFSFRYLLKQRSRNSDSRSFLKVLLQQLAARKSVSHEFLLVDLAFQRDLAPRGNTATKQSLMSATFSSALLALVEEAIVGIELHVANASHTLVDPESRHLYSNSNLLLYWLTWGTLPPWSLPVSAGELAKRVAQLFGECPDEAGALVGRARIHSSVPRILSSHLDNADLITMLKAMAPQETQMMMSCIAIFQESGALSGGQKMYRALACEAVLSFCFRHPGDVRTQLWVGEVIAWLATKQQSSVRKLSRSLLTVVEQGELELGTAPELIAAIRNLSEPSSSPALNGDLQSRSADTQNNLRPRAKLGPASEIENWLVYGIYPQSVSSPRDADLRQWLEAQNDEDWLNALHSCGPKESAIHRIICHLSSEFFERAVRLVAHDVSGLALDYLQLLETAVKQLAPGADSPSVNQVRKYALAYLLRSFSTSGRQSISVVELGCNTLHALSLSCQVAPSRLLATVQEKSQSHHGIQHLSRMLEESFEVGANPQADDIALLPATLDADTASTGADLVLYYFEHGSIPSWASVSSLSALRRLTETLSADQLMIIASASRSLLATKNEVARRISILLSDRTFLQITSHLFPDTHLLIELENVLSILAADLGSNARSLITMARSRLLEDSAYHQVNAAADVSRTKHLLARILLESAAYLGKSPGVLLNQLRLAANKTAQHNSTLVPALAELAHDASFALPETSLPNPQADSVELAAAVATNGGTLPQLQYLLQHGELPEPAKNAGLECFMEKVAQELQQNPDVYRQYLRSAAGRKLARKRIARFFPFTLLDRLWPLFFTGFKFGAELERVVSVLAARLLVSEDILILAAREELLKCTTQSHATTSAESVLTNLLTSLPTVLAERSGVVSATMLVQFMEVLQKSKLSSYLGALSSEQDRLGTRQLVKIGNMEGRPQGSTVEEMVLVPGFAPSSRQSAARNIPSFSEDGRQNHLDALVYFLRTGSMPWWGKTLAMEPSSQWLSSVLADRSGKILHILQSLTEKPGGIERLVRYLPPQTLARIVNLASPDYGSFILIYIAAGGGLSQDATFSAGQRSRTAFVHWHEVLALLLDEHTPRMSPGEFLRNMTARVSQRLGLPLARYVGCLRRGARQRAETEPRYLALSDMLFHIHDVSATAIEQEAAAMSAEPQDAEPSDPVAPTIESDPGVDTLRQLQYLLQYGEMPEASMEFDQERFMEMVAQDLLQHPHEYQRYLRNAAGRDLERKRIARMFPAKVLTRLWPLLLPADHAFAMLCLNVLQEAMRQVFSVGLPERWRWVGVEELLRTISQPQSRRWDSSAYFRSMIGRVGEEQSQNSATLLACLRTAAGHKNKEVQEKLLSAIDRVERETTVIPVRKANLNDRPTQKTVLVHPKYKNAKELPQGESFYIANAGAVLLWPFLGRYFQMLSLLEKNAFRDTQAQSRAVYLLQYLVSGQMEAPEHELLLNKILCGVKLGEPLEHCNALTEAEQQVSEQLLHGVTQNWEKLRNTSIAGLRQTFLLREGRLQRKDDAWSLTVSAKPFDVLLDSLPWRLSMVRLPWMETILHVKWR